MRDYVYTDGTPISRATTARIERCLREGFSLVTEQASREAIVERLRLELYIRANNLRAGLE